MKRMKLWQGLAVGVAMTGLSMQAQGVATRQLAGFASNTLAANDDGSTGPVAVGFNLDFFGFNTNTLHVNNNGNVTLDGSNLGAFTPISLLTTGRSIIAPFFGDVDTRQGNVATYGNDVVNGRAAFGVEWIDVRHFSFGLPTNTFELVIIDRSDVNPGDFDFEFNFDQVLWEAGTASGSDSLGLGGNSARVGYANGTTATFELPGSAVNGAFLDSGPVGTSLIQNSLNSNVLGRYVFSVRNGQVIVDPSPSNGAVPEPITATLGLMGLATLAAASRRRRTA